jgi:hypothetical protein
MGIGSCQMSRQDACVKVERQLFSQRTSCTIQRKGRKRSGIPDYG